MDQVRLSTDEIKVNVPKFERLELSFAYTRVHSYAAQEFNFFLLAEFSLVVTADGCLYAFGCCEKVSSACCSAISSL